jgi:hypothetical protein
MLLPDDDELYEVDQTYLGPPKRYIAPMRHKAIFAWLVVAPLLFVGLNKVGVQYTLLTGSLTFLATVWVAMEVADRVTPETPVSAVVAGLWHELKTPRATKRGNHTSGAGFGRVISPRGSWGRYVRRARAQSLIDVETS